jgi:peptidoglycan hydrolase-like protein with peptidoglycan-binding domain
MSGADVTNLQRYLNSHGFALATTGTGSSGQETDYFGKLTFNALVKFQNAHAADILMPLHLSSGTGIFGSGTIAFITGK